MSAMLYIGQSKLATNYLAASQIAPLFNLAVSQYSPLNMWLLVNSRPYYYIYLAATSKIAPLCNKAVSQNLLLNTWRTVKTRR